MMSMLGINFWSDRIKGRAFSLKLAAALAMERLLVGLHCQEEIDYLFLKELKISYRMCRVTPSSENAATTASISTQFRSNFSRSF